jgi:hypothetical protein
LDATSQKETSTMNERSGQEENVRLQQQWHGWASPVGMGIGMLCIFGGFALLAFGLTLLSSI